MIRFLLLLLLCSLATVLTARAQFQDPATVEETVSAHLKSASASEQQAVPNQATPKKPKATFWTLVQAGGKIGYIIMLLSLVSVSLMIEYALSIRRKVLMPPNFADAVIQHLIQGQSNVALQKCQRNPSALAQILYAGMSQYEFGWDAVEKSAEEATADQASRLYRKVDFLNVIGNIAPMLGLLGTVVGMVIAFQHLAESEGYGRAAELAEGIYLALVTTVQGLLVAIPCLAAHSFYNYRIAKLISETAHVAEHVLQPIKKNLLRKSK